MILTESDERRFYAKVALPNEQGCMLWTACVLPNGYGVFSLTGKLARAHRVSYTLAYGEIPEGLVIDHVKARGCANRHCVAPLHLEAVTQGGNVRRGDAGRWRGAETHCIHGHAFDAKNTYVCSQGKRKCRTCNRERHRAAYQP